MECWCVSKHKSWFYWLSIFMMMPILMVQQIQGGCIEDERKALLEIKTSLVDSYGPNRGPLLPTWVDDGNAGGRGRSECCDWERVKCNTTTGHVTNLSLSNILGLPDDYYEECRRIWPLNVSLFLHFKELRSLNLSFDCLDNGIVSTGLERLSSLKKLEILDLSWNSIDNDIFPSLSAFTSLRALYLTYNNLKGYFPALALENLEILDLSYNDMQGFERISMLRKLEVLNLGGNYRFNESLITSLSALPSLKALDLFENNLEGSFPAQGLSHLTNMEKLDLSYNSFNSTPSIQDCKSLSRLKRLQSILLSFNDFDKSIISCLNFLPSLKTLDLSSSLRSSEGSFPIQGFTPIYLCTRSKFLLDLPLAGPNSKGGHAPLTPLDEEGLSHFTNMEKLDLSHNGLNNTPSIQDCKSLSRLKRLESISLGDNHFDKSIISCLSFLPSLKTLDLTFSLQSEGLFPSQELSHFSNLEGLLLSDNGFNGTLAMVMEVLTSFHHLEVLDLSGNEFVGSIPSTIQALSSLRVVSFAYNNLNGSLHNHGLCELNNLHVLDLSRNMFDGKLPQCFKSLSSLKLLDVSSNRFTGILLPSLIVNLTSLEYVDFSNNKFEGSFSFSSFSNHTKLEAIKFMCDNDKFEVEAEEPVGWIPMFQLKALVISGCNLNRPQRRVVPRFLLHQYRLQVLDLSHNSLEGRFPNWLIKNNTMLRVLNLRENSFGDNIWMSSYHNVNTRWLDVSGNHLIGTIPSDIQKFLPYIEYLNLSRNSLDGLIPSSIGDLDELQMLDLSDNNFSGELPKGLFTNINHLSHLKLSNNKLHGEVLSSNLSFGNIEELFLDNNCFTGEIENGAKENHYLEVLDMSNNYFTGMIPSWISNMSILHELVVRNNSLGGRFPCGRAPFSFLDISQNYFSGPIPSCLNLQYIKHLHLGSNRFIGSIPHVFRNLTHVLTLDIGNNNLSGKIPKFLGKLSNLRILILRENNFIGSLPMQLCQLSNVSFIDLSDNSISGSIPRCLHNVNNPAYRAFTQYNIAIRGGISGYEYTSALYDLFYSSYFPELLERQDEVHFTTKALSLPYKGNILNNMTGLDLSCNKLTGEIPEELGLLTQVQVLNLSHNQLDGPIPMKFSCLANIESLDLSSNGLSGNVPSQLIKLTYLASFNVSYNNLSGRLPDMEAQFSTFTKESYEGNPLLCGPPLDKKCKNTSHVTAPLAKDDIDKWYDIDMSSFYGSSGSTWVVFLLGFAAILYTNPHWRKRWLDFVEECMYTCYYFLDDSVSKLSMFFRK